MSTNALLLAVAETLERDAAQLERERSQG